MAGEKRRLTLSRETLRTLSATALSQVAGGTAYSSQYCSPTSACYSGTVGTDAYPCAPTPCQTANAQTRCGAYDTGSWNTCASQYSSCLPPTSGEYACSAYHATDCYC